jgi:hypothetical protein
VWKEEETTSVDFVSKQGSNYTPASFLVSDDPFVTARNVSLHE